MATQTLLTVEQFLELPDREGVRRELDEGRLIETPRASFLHGFVRLNSICRAGRRRCGRCIPRPAR